MAFLQVRVPISPTEAFFRRLHFLAAALSTQSGRCADFEMVVSVGEDCEPYDLERAQPWSRHYPIRWRWIDRDLFRRESYFATRVDRIAQSSTSSFVLICDADVLPMRDLQPLLDELERAPAMCGVTAHISPFADYEAGLECWHRLFRPLGFASAPLEFEHSGWGVLFKDESLRYCPAYFNMGMVIGPTALLNPVCGGFRAEIESVNRGLGKESYYRTQMAMTLSMYRHGVPRRALPARFNFPNDPRFDRAFPEELDEVVLIHYLRHKVLNRGKDFTSREALEELLRRTDLSGSNEALRKRLAELYPRVAREEASSA